MTTTCKVEGCTSKVHAFDTCHKHYRRYRETGHYHPQQRATRPLQERFWEKVDKSAGTEGCWTWTAGTNGSGYGRIQAGTFNAPETALAHRLSWEWANNASAAGMFVCHRCDNPPCVNPAHLFLGTQLDNMRDMARKRRGRKPERSTQ